MSQAFKCDVCRKLEADSFRISRETTTRFPGPQNDVWLHISFRHGKVGNAQPDSPSDVCSDCTSLLLSLIHPDLYSAPKEKA